MEPVELSLASAARAWCANPSGDDRLLADALELWIAAVLATDPGCSLRGRWFDGLLFEACDVVAADQLFVSGSIWLLDSFDERLPFRATLLLSDRGLRSFELIVGRAQRDFLSRAIHRLADEPGDPHVFRFQRIA